MTSVRMFTEHEVIDVLAEAGVTSPELAREYVDRYAEKHMGGALRAHGASAVAGTTLVDVDEGQQILVPTPVADAIYAVAEHFGVTVRSLITELQVEVRRRRASEQAQPPE